MSGRGNPVRSVILLRRLLCVVAGIAVLVALFFGIYMWAVNQDTTGFGTDRYVFDLEWMMGKTISEIYERYGVFYDPRFTKDTQVVNGWEGYVVRVLDGAGGNGSATIYFDIYFNDEGVATRFRERLGIPGG